MGKIDFLIFYEHKNREFESIVLLKHELVRRGYTVKFFSFDEMYNKKKRRDLFGNVKIAVMPSLYHNEEILNFVYGVAGKVKNIVNLRWEQIFSNQIENNLDYYVYPKENAKYGYHCCWGTRPLEMLRSVNVEEDKVFITGPIQMDFLRKELTGWYKSRKELFDEYDIDLNKNCVLFTSSFVSSSWDKWSLEWLYSQFDDEERAYSKNNLSREIKSRETIISWLINLAQTKDCTIIYRPHPAEVQSVITEQIKDYENIKVIGDYNIKQWILTCDQVYTWNSTSLAEASVAGIPCAVLRPVGFEKNNEYPIYEGMPYITTYQQLEDLFEDKKQKSNNEQLISKDKLNTYLSVDPDIPSYIRTADVLERSLKDNYYFPWGNFPKEDFLNMRKSKKKLDRRNIMATIVVKPFYRTKILIKIIRRLSPNLYQQYIELIKRKQKVVSEHEFNLAEERITAVLSRSV